MILEGVRGLERSHFSRINNPLLPRSYCTFYLASRLPSCTSKLLCRSDFIDNYKLIQVFGRQKPTISRTGQWPVLHLSALGKGSDLSENVAPATMKHDCACCQRTRRDGKNRGSRNYKLCHFIARRRPKIRRVGPGEQWQGSRTKRSRERYYAF